MIDLKPAEKSRITKLFGDWQDLVVSIQGDRYYYYIGKAVIATDKDVLKLKPGVYKNTNKYPLSDYLSELIDRLPDLIKAETLKINTPICFLTFKQVEKVKDICQIAADLPAAKMLVASGGLRVECNNGLKGFCYHSHSIKTPVDADISYSANRIAHVFSVCKTITFVYQTIDRYFFQSEQSTIILMKEDLR